MQERFRIFITEPRDHPALARLRGLGEVRQGPSDRRMDERELVDEVREAHAVLITSRDRITRPMIERAGQLRVIGKFGARPENVDWEAARARGVRIVWSPEANSDSVAEYTVLLILAHLRHLVQAVGHLREGGWRNTFPQGRELRARTVGLVGLGNVGSRVARCLSGFGATVLGHDPFLPPARAAGLDVHLVALPDLLAQADVVSLHAMVTPESRHMIDEGALRRMKPGALLVDTLGGSASARTDKKEMYPADDLSPSELRVLRYLPTNLTRLEVAQQLYVSVNTVNTHVRNIYSKLGVRDRSAAVQRARELRLLSSGL